ncbi:PstS family phosphate ABC transporter substrate-binding protein [Geothrix sp. 21YS21S-2]|uniref:PstS family phosphate ABC transporter substrate-binding protein n=1 Tax=Geothrix sp. 21YS21S-2 TaxID=3068893 RepID=UPI0027B8ED17|nr:PstS family phosphate ABC transporter substrate-binding protein [Geothrix sp. 21YS21S-2]
MLKRMVALAFLSLGVTAFAFAAGDVQPEKSAIEGHFSMKGSDSMDPLIRLWISEFQKQNPKVEIKIESPGSNTAPPALTAGEVRLGHMSREMNPEEQAAFQSRRGFPVTRLVVAMDALAIYVHRGNPVRRIALGQLDAIYSTTRLSGWDRPLGLWGELGAGGRWRKRPIHVYGRDEKSGSRVFFDEKVLGKGGIIRAGYQARDQWGIEEAVSKDPAGIGYGPANYASSDVKMLPVFACSGMYYMPSTENILNGRYPLTRRLNIYVDKEPGKPLPEAPLAFLKFILGPQGQRLVQEYGSVPVGRDLLEKQLLSLER